MIIHDQLQFIGVGALEPTEAGLRLQRCPEIVRSQLNEGAQQRMLLMAGGEIRFIADSDEVSVTLHCPEGSSCEITPYWGDFMGLDRFRIQGETKTIVLKRPPKLQQLDSTRFPGLKYSVTVWRLVLRGGPVHYVGIDGEGIRSPEPAQLPGKTLLAYGTSITQGAAATGAHLTYIAQTAHRLGMSHINLGCGGSAHCESAMADYIASKTDWDVCVLCLSVNMVGAKFTAEQFRERVHYMIETISRHHPDKPVYCISILPYYHDYPDLEGNREPLAAISEQFRHILAELVQKLNRSNVRFIAGDQLLPDFGGLTVDLIHPSDFGMIQIGERLAARIAETWEK